MTFEFDPAKEQINIQKHGLDFNSASLIFENPTVEKEDTRKEYGEKRIQCIGTCNGVILYVVYTWRGQNRRIISARIANKAERDLYHDTLHPGLAGP